MEVRRRSLVRGLALGSVGALAGCSGTVTDEAFELGVGSKNYTEQIILGYMSYEILASNTDAAVVDELNYGDTHETFDGFLQGHFHTYWDYTGTLWMVNEPKHEETFDDADEQYQAVKAEMEAEYDCRILDRTAFENRWAFFGRSETLAETGIETISDLAAHVNANNYDVTIVLEKDFYGRDFDGWGSLTEYYGFETSSLQAWEDAGGVIVTDEGLAYDEVQRQGRDIGIGYSTDPQLVADDLSVIEDDQSFWPYYHLVPLLASEKATDAVVSELNKLPAAIEDAEMMRSLNARHNQDGEDYQEIARSFLDDAGLI